MNVFVFRHVLSIALLASFAGAVHAQPATALEQRLHQEMQTVLLRLVESGELQPADAESLSLMAQASRQPDFGAILDVRHRAETDAGLPVLGVTPGGSAAALGVRPGDRLLAVNAVSLVGLGADAQGRSFAAQRLREELLSDPDAVEVRVARDGGEQVLSGPVRVVELPAYRLELGAALANASLAATTPVDAESICGRVSVFDIAPRTQRLYAATLIAVDGKLPGPTGSDVYRLTPGVHRLTVAEAIDPRQFGEVQRLQRNRSSRDRYKDIEVDVKPGITYRLAAKFHIEERYSIRDGAYWEPVIWKESPERCQ